MLHISTTSLILVGVFAHLLLSLSKLVFKSPKQAALLDAMDGKIDGVVSTVRQVLPAIQKVLPAVQAITPKNFSTPLSSIQTVEELSLALNSLPSDPSKASSTSSSLPSASGGA